MWCERLEHYEGFTEIIVLSMQSMKTDGEFYDMTLCMCVCVCAQEQARETADFAVILKDGKQNGLKWTLFLSFPPFPTPPIAFRLPLYLLCLRRERETV